MSSLTGIVAIVGAITALLNTVFAYLSTIHFTKIFCCGIESDCMNDTTKDTQTIPKVVDTKAISI